MITVAQALQLVQDNAEAIRERQSIAVTDAVGRILSINIEAPISLPSFRQSSMDGYALRFDSSLANLSTKDASTSYTIVGEIQAGSSEIIPLNPGEAVRIFTGARVPDQADAVVIQERTSRENKRLFIEQHPKKGDNIRPIGSQIKMGNLALEGGHYITPASIGLLKSLGFEHISVNRQPRISVIVTGDELISTGSTLKGAQIYESNSAVLQTALKQYGIHTSVVLRAEDSLEATTKAIRKALDSSDVILISGGISVGDYDFVNKALQDLGVAELFYKVLQKPGKPLFFGKKKEAYVFALPGNPASTLSCFYVYVHLLLDILSGASHQGLLRLKLPIAETYTNQFQRALFLKARIIDQHVHILNAQNSATMITFAEANALAFIPENITVIPKDSEIEVLILPYGSNN